MQYLLSLADASHKHLVVFTLPEDIVRRPAADFIFDVVGVDDPEALHEAKLVSDEQIADLKALQQAIFARDEQGLLIHESVSFEAAGRPVDPDAPLVQAFVPSEREGMKYMRCELTVIDSSTPAAIQACSQSKAKQMELFAQVMFLHQIARGTLVDVTREYPELADMIASAERNGLVEIDVKKAAFKLTDTGKRAYASFIAEAQDLIKRFDIYGDVDFDPATGLAHFDTQLGRDLRACAFEMEGIDPFRARFLLGINDGEWDNLSDWTERIAQESWYNEVFAPIEQATSIAEIGHENMQKIMQQAKCKLRQDTRLN